MPQHFQVLRCFICSVFQVHQVKKSNKFECKLCGEKQSIKRHYGIGTGKECRLHVQKLNAIRADIDNIKNSLSSDEENFDEVENIETTKNQALNVKRESKWSEYIEEPDCPEENVNNDMCLDDAEIVLERPAKRRKFIRNKMRHNKRGFYKHEDGETLEEELAINEPVIRNHNSVDVSNSSVKTESEINPSSSRKTMPTKFVPPTCKNQSKWAQFTDETDENLPNNDCPDNLESGNFRTENASLETKPILSNNTFKPQRNESVNKFSKWDFHEDLEKPSKIVPRFNVLEPVSKSKNNTQKLFSLCNDNDLDNILDI